ncbi:MAG: TetR/AcrR family transcriptional regulator [bacterium]|nr:TetR/AcrR family transcriptional regulator [bacterium]
MTENSVIDEKHEKKPHGKKEVVEALIQSAAELFAEQGIGAVSIRDIAAHANVNPGLVHRHFKSKENLRKKTQEYLAKKIRDEIGTPDNLVDALKKAQFAISNQPLFWKVMARTFLDNSFDGDVQSSFPFVKQLVDFVRQGQDQGIITKDLEAEYIIAAVTAYGFGMRVFERYIMDGTGLGNVDIEDALLKIHSYFISTFVFKPQE